MIVWEAFHLSDTWYIAGTLGMFCSDMMFVGELPTCLEIEHACATIAGRLVDKWATHVKELERKAVMARQCLTECDKTYCNLLAFTLTGEIR